MRRLPVSLNLYQMAEVDKHPINLTVYRDLSDVLFHYVSRMIPIICYPLNFFFIIIRYCTTWHLTIPLHRFKQPISQLSTTYYNEKDIITNDHFDLLYGISICGGK